MRVNEVSTLVHVQFKINTEIANFQFYLNSQHKVNQICYIGEKVADRFVDEAKVMNQIREKSRTKTHLSSFFQSKKTHQFLKVNTI